MSRPSPSAVEALALDARGLGLHSLANEGEGHVTLLQGESDLPLGMDLPAGFHSGLRGGELRLTRAPLLTIAVSRGQDRLKGSERDDVFFPQYGRDEIDGRESLDVVAYGSD